MYALYSLQIVLGLAEMSLSRIFFMPLVLWALWKRALIIKKEFRAKKLQKSFIVAVTIRIVISHQGPHRRPPKPRSEPGSPD
jgi:hypothetical protein